MSESQRCGRLIDHTLRCGLGEHDELHNPLGPDGRHPFDHLPAPARADAVYADDRTLVLRTLGHGSRVRTREAQRLYRNAGPGLER